MHQIIVSLLSSAGHIPKRKTNWKSLLHNRSLDSIVQKFYSSMLVHCSECMTLGRSQVTHISATSKEKNATWMNHRPSSFSLPLQKTFQLGCQELCVMLWHMYKARGLCLAVRLLSWAKTLWLLRYNLALCKGSRSFFMHLYRPPEAPQKAIIDLQENHATSLRCCGLQLCGNTIKKSFV